MKKIFLTVVFVMLAMVMAFAQAQVGIRAGASWSNVRWDNDPPAGEVEPWRAGLTLGVASSFRLGEVFAVAPELSFSQRRNEWQEAGITRSARYNFLELPVLFRVMFGHTLKGYLNAGPAISYWLGGDEDDEEINFSELDDANRWDIGASVGGGLHLDTGIGSFLLDLRYTRGFSEFRNISRNENLRHQLVSTSLIFLVPSANTSSGTRRVY